MCRGGNIIFFLSTSGSCTMLGSPGLRSDLGGQFFSIQYFSRALISHIQRKQRYFVYPCCWPRRKDTILRSTQMIQLCLPYCSNSITLFTSPYSSQRQTECATGTAPNKLPLCRRTHFKLHFELSKNIRHSFGLWIESPNSFSKPGILWQNTKPLSLRKYCRNVLSLVRKYDTFTPSSSRFFSFSLDASISEAFLIGPNYVLNHLTRADQIPYELDPRECQNLHHCSYHVLQHHSDLLDEELFENWHWNLSWMRHWSYSWWYIRIFYFTFIFLVKFLMFSLNKTNSPWNDLFALAKPCGYQMASFHMFLWSTSVNSQHNACTLFEGPMACLDHRVSFLKYVKYACLTNTLMFALWLGMVKLPDV